MPAVALPPRASHVIGMEERVSTAASLDALQKRVISLAANRFCNSVCTAAATGLEQHPVIVSALQQPLDLNSIL